ncbi:DUF4044 domain-containing protein [Moraxella osloensis]|nr:DUF4044 domain-containing protein [Moraxella osloensis]
MNEIVAWLMVILLVVSVINHCQSCE